MADGMSDTGSCCSLFADNSDDDKNYVPRNSDYSSSGKQKCVAYIIFLVLINFNVFFYIK